MPDGYVRDLSLKHHLALAGCMTGDGNHHLLVELIRTTYLAFYLWEAGIGDANLGMFLDAEIILDRAVLRAEASRRWCVEAGEDEAVKALLRLHDSQIGSVSARIFIESRTRLDRLLSVGRSSSPLARHKSTAKRSLP
ncbi:Fis family transcriptional regulator [Burkholderia lata]|nr:Fis family transcriptional regulator [Burkholderia lata]